jgi:hypothetical protein
MKLEGQVGTLPVAAFDWMRDRVHESPQTMNIFRLFCDYQLVIAFKYAARNKDWERHLVVIQLSQSIQAMTHGLTYVRMGFDLLRDSTVCWSDIENQIVKDRLYVLQSEHGELIEHDLVQEKHIRIIRENTRHEYCCGHQAKVEEAALAGISHASNNHIKHAIKRLGLEQGSQLETTKTLPDWTQDKRVVKAFANTFLLLVNGKFFMRGLSNGEEDDKTLTSAIDGKPLDSMQLDARPIGDEKVKKYGT